MTAVPHQPSDTSLESDLRDAIHAYVFQPQPGANRTTAYNLQRVEARMSEESDPANARIVGRVLELLAPPARILEVGAGTGGLSAALGKVGFEVDAVEPDLAGVRAATLRAMRYPDTVLRFHEAVVEHLPFPDSSFDAVVSTQLLEHVGDLGRAIGECHRVLKPGGVSLHLMPNYAFPFEPHYRVFYPPRASKALGELYLRARGRDVRLLREHIFPTFPAEVVRTFRQAGYVDVENRYAAEVERKFDGGEVRTEAVGRAMRVASQLRILPLVKRLVLGLELYPSIVIVARKARAAA
jgi:ubiquinone/menaquinone biosynthesis C-methylase UbiE